MATEIINERLLYPSYEIIGGEKIMAPAPNPTHGSIVGRLYMFIGAYLDANDSGYVFIDNTDVHFPDGSLLKPDLSVVTQSNSAIVDWLSGIYGTPDMLVEILSRSTKKRDITVKKDIYEANGVREYWIINPWDKSIAVYLLRDGKFFLDDIYAVFDENDLEMMTDAEREAVKTEIPVTILDGLTIPLTSIFKWGYK